MLGIIRVLVTAVAGAVAFAAPAAADEDDFVRMLRERYVFLSEQQLRAEGAKVCDVIRAGTPSPDAVIMVRDNLGVSVSAANEIVSTAVVELGC